MAKNTALGKDANIYKKRTPQREIVTFKSLTFKKKLQYIKDYYLKAFLASGIVIAVVLYFIINLIIPKDEVVLRLVTINDAYSEEATESLINDFGKLIDFNPDKEDITIQDGFIMDLDRVNRTVENQITVYATTGTLDVIIADKDVFSNYAKNGAFCDLSEVLSKEELDNLTKDLFYTKKRIQADDSTEPSNDQNEDANIEHAYGVCLDNSSVYSNYSEWYKQHKDSENSYSFYIGILNNSSQKENAVSFIRYLKDIK